SKSWDDTGAGPFAVPGFGGIQSFGVHGPMGKPYDFSGAIGGGQIGANYQVGAIVIGIQGDIAATNAEGVTTTCNSPLPTAPPPGAILRCANRADWLASATARVGYSFDHALLYAKGGGAWLHERFDLGRGEAFAALFAVTDSTTVTRNG